MTTWDWRRWTGVFGLAWLLVQIVGVFLLLSAGNPPDFGDAKKYSSWVSSSSGLFLGDAFVTGVATLILLVQFTGVRSLIRDAGEDWEWASALFFGAGLITAAVVMIGAAAEATAAFISGSATEPTTVRAAWAASQVLFTFVYLPAGIAIGTAGYVVLRAAILPRWLGWLSVVCAALDLLAGLTVFGGTGTYGPVGLLPLLLGSTPIVVWFLAVSIVLLGGAPRVSVARRG